jgi:hypothetical protein
MVTLILGLFIDAIHTAWFIQRRMTMVVNDEVGRMWKEKAVVQFKSLNQHPERAEENSGKY